MRARQLLNRSSCVKRHGCCLTAYTANWPVPLLLLLRLPHLPHTPAVDAVAAPSSPDAAVPTATHIATAVFAVFLQQPLLLQLANAAAIYTLLDDYKSAPRHCDVVTMSKELFFTNRCIIAHPGDDHSIEHISNVSSGALCSSSI